MPTVGENLRRFRQEAGLGQVELSRAARISQPTISELERGLRDPHQSTLQRLADALGVSVADFFAQTASPRLPPPPKTPLTSATPEELETRLFGAPAAEIEGELSPVVSEPEARELSDAARRERDALESWLAEYATAPSAERFARRADHERVKSLQDRARFYHDYAFNTWSLLFDPRPAGFMSTRQFATETVEARTRFLTALENEAETQRIERSGEVG